MQLIAVLSSGVNGGESGHAEIFSRGTSTRATYYSSFEGDVHGTSGLDLELDSNGGAEVYVDEYVDVVVYSSSGTAVRPFTVGATTNNVEYKGQSFTGTDYDDGTSAANDPVDLQTLLNLWKDQQGAIDWKVAFEGSAQTIQAALGSLTGAVFNVKDPTYGATGDGVADDTTEVQAAITAAAAATFGGVVFFPPGTYLVSAALTLPNDVSLLGAGADYSTITMNHASASLISMTGTTQGFYQYVSRLTLAVSQANSGNLVDNTGTQRLELTDCDIGGTNANGADLVNNTGNSVLNVRRCEIEVGSETGNAINIAEGIVEDCLFVVPATYNSAGGIIDIDTSVGTIIRGCRFDNSTATAGTYSCIVTATSQAQVQIVDNTFLDSGGATVTCMEFGAYTNGVYIYESNSIIEGWHQVEASDGNLTPYSYTPDGTVGNYQVWLGTRVNLVRTQTATTVNNPTVDFTQAATVFLTNTFAGDSTITETLPPPGNPVNFIYTNGDGTDRQITGTDSNLSSIAVTTGQELVCVGSTLLGGSDVIVMWTYTQTAILPS